MNEQNETVHNWVIQAEIDVHSPLRIGTGRTCTSEADSAGNILDIDLDKDGRPVIRGRVLKGLTRDFVARRLDVQNDGAISWFHHWFGAMAVGSYMPKGGHALFGAARWIEQGKPSSETLFGHKRNPLTGTVEGSAFWGARQVPIGARFAFSIIVEQTSETNLQPWIGAMVQAFSRGAIGRNKSSGYGSFSVDRESLSVRRLTHNALSNWWASDDENSHWTQLIEQGSPDEIKELKIDTEESFASCCSMYFSERDIDRLCFELDLVFLEPFFHAASPDKVGEERNSDIVPLNINGPMGGTSTLLPSALKGALRAQAQRILNTLRAYRADDSSDEQDDALISQLFGSEAGQQAHLTVEFPKPADAQPRKQRTQHFIAKDRFANRNHKSALFQIDAASHLAFNVPLNLEFSRKPLDSRISGVMGEKVDDKESTVESAALGLFYLCLKDLAQGDIRLGGKTTGGYGACRLKKVRIGVSPDGLIDQDPVCWNKNVTGLNTILSKYFEPGDRKELDQPQTFIDACVAAFNGRYDTNERITSSVWDRVTDEDMLDGPTGTRNKDPFAKLPAGHMPYCFVPKSITNFESADHGWKKAKDFREKGLGLVSHDRYANECLSGRLLVRMDTQPGSPLFVGGEQRNAKELYYKNKDKSLTREEKIGSYTLVDWYKEQLTRNSNEETIRAIPAASLKGGISVIHESMTGSALRIFDEERLAFIPNKELLPYSSVREYIAPTEMMFGTVDAKPSNSKTEHTALKGRLHFSSAIPLDAGEIIEVSPCENEKWENEANAQRTNNPVFAEKKKQLKGRLRLRTLSSPKDERSVFYYKNRPDNSERFPAKGAIWNRNQLVKENLDSKKHIIRGSKMPVRGASYSGPDYGQTKMAIHQDVNAHLRMAIQPPVDGTFWFSIDFNQLDPTEYEDLIMSLLPDNEFLHQFGLGASLGLGQVKLTAMASCFVDRVHRYTQRNGDQQENRYSECIKDKAYGELEKHQKEWLKERFPHELEAIEDIGVEGDHTKFSWAAQKRWTKRGQGASLQAVRAIGKRETAPGEIRWPIVHSQWTKNQYETHGYKWSVKHASKLDGGEVHPRILESTWRLSGDTVLPLIWSVVFVGIKGHEPSDGELAAYRRLSIDCHLMNEETFKRIISKPPPGEHRTEPLVVLCKTKSKDEVQTLLHNSNPSTDWVVHTCDSFESVVDAVG